MKVVIAAAGKGTRMLPLTKDKPKHLIEVNNRPFLSYVLDNVLKAGIKDIIVVGGYKGEQIKKFLTRHYQFAGGQMVWGQGKINAVFINQFKIFGEEEYGTALPVKCVKEYVGSENFLFVSGDNIYSPSDLKEMAIDDNYNYIAGIESKTPEKYGVLSEENGFLQKIVEKPKEYIGNLINTGLYKFTPEIFEKIGKIEKSARGEYEIINAINLLAEEKKVKVKKIKDYWLDFGSIEDIEKVSRFLNENRYKKSN